MALATSYITNYCIDNDDNNNNNNILVVSFSFKPLKLDPSQGLI